MDLPSIDGASAGVPTGSGVGSSTSPYGNAWMLAGLPLVMSPKIPDDEIHFVTAGKVVGIVTNVGSHGINVSSELIIGTVTVTTQVGNPASETKTDEA